MQMLHEWLNGLHKRELIPITIKSACVWLAIKHICLANKIDCDLWIIVLQFLFIASWFLVVRQTHGWPHILVPLKESNHATQ